MADRSTSGAPIGAGDDAARHAIEVRRKRLEVSRARDQVEENEIRLMELQATIDAGNERVIDLETQLHDLDGERPPNGKESG